MKTKKSNLMFACFFALIFLIGFTSAAITLTPSVTSLSQSGGSFTLTVLSNVNETVQLTIPSLSDDSERRILFSLSPNQITLDSDDNSSVINVTYVVESGFNFEFSETYTANINAVGSVSGTSTKAINFANSGFCEYENPGNLRTTVEDITVTGYGEDDEWFAFDTIEIEVTVENRGNEDIDNIVLEWGLYNTQSGEWTIEVDEYDEFDLNDDDEETFTIEFTLDDDLDEDLADLEEGDYVFYVKATGEVAEGDDEGENTCSADSQTGNLILENDFVVVSNLRVAETVQCGSEVQITGDVWNIGSRDQDDVYIEITNKELGIDERVDIGDIDSFDSTDFDFTLELPEELTEKTYYLTITVYDEDDDVYENENDEKSTSALPLIVQGNCAVSKASVSAALESGGEAGKQMVIKSTITNTGTKAALYSLNLAGYSDWASSVDIDKQVLTLNPGESGNVLMTFDVNSDVEGAKLFTLEVISENEVVVSQPVQVEITKKPGLNLFSGDNKYIWGIGLLNLILIILIIVIAVRIARK